MIDSYQTGLASMNPADPDSFTYFEEGTSKASAEQANHQFCFASLDGREALSTPEEILQRVCLQSAALRLAHIASGSADFCGNSGP